ncbi:hypothetical protein NXH76_20895 [Blautia schinkii]|nr:hypothetical protein [Blautia schinkii]
MNRQEREANLIVVTAAEEYSLRYHMPVKDVVSLLNSTNQKKVRKNG